MKTALYNELLEKGAFNNVLPKLFQDIVDSNYFNVPQRMKALIVLSELMSYTSQFRKNIKLLDDTIVPINAVSFVIAGSGGG